MISRFTGWLDDLTGRVTMYRLMVICLLALLVEALLVSVVGQLGYSPLGILLVAVVAVAVAYLANRLFALIFRVRPHSESALISGLIISLLYTPNVSGPQLFAVALAALLAMATKYLLAIRRRHVFNPAAAGAFLSGLILPTNPATWWVGNPWLFPVALVAAFVILYRTRHLLLGIVFVVVGAASSIYQQMAFGSDFSLALPSTFFSLPIIFFAGFMLSEPLTLPPRRWQQLAEAAIVGVLYGLVISLGFTTTSYLTALLVGNLLAFLVGQRRGIRLTFLGREQLSDSAWELSFQPLRPIRFEAGQYIELTLPHKKQDVRGLRRTFSIASAPSGDVVKLGIRTAKRSSSFKTTLLGLTPGETITATSVGGDFVLPRDTATPVLLVAGGIGITPYVSHLAELDASGEKRDVVLVYSSSSTDDLAYAERLDNADHRVLLVAPSEPKDLPAHWSYLGAGPLTADLLTSAVPDARGRAAYVSGPPSLVRALRPALKKAGVRSVKSDYFSGY